jgi:hypothetical protein
MSESPPKSGTSGAANPFTPQSALEFMQRMWNPLGMPLPGFALPGAVQAPAGMGAQPGGGLPFPNPAAMFAALDPAEIERKIGELQVIENWLAMSLSMIQMSIKTLELQKASLEALRGAGTAAAASMSPSGGEEPGRRPRRKG